MTASVSAEEILLKKEILQGWEYSVDSGDTYQEVGTYGTTLRQLISSSSRADFEMEQYAKKKKISMATGYIGTGCVGALLIVSVYDDWHDEYKWLIVGGVGVGFVSAIYGTIAKNHIKEAVRVYNRDQAKGISVEVCLQPMFAQRSPGAKSFLRIKF
jgi:hypothetical protein